MSISESDLKSKTKLNGSDIVNYNTLNDNYDVTLTNDKNLLSYITEVNDQFSNYQKTIQTGDTLPTDTTIENGTIFLKTSTSTDDFLNTISSYYSSTHTPENYGAVGDGSTDDSEALQAWIDDCSVNGYYMECTEGKTYKCTKTLYFANRMVCNFGGSTILSTADENDNIPSPAIKIFGWIFTDKTSGDLIKPSTLGATEDLTSYSFEKYEKIIDIYNLKLIQLGLYGVDIKGRQTYFHNSEIIVKLPEAPGTDTYTSLRIGSDSSDGITYPDSTATNGIYCDQLHFRVKYYNDKDSNTYTLNTIAIDCTTSRHNFYSNIRIEDYGTAIKTINTNYFDNIQATPTSNTVSNLMTSAQALKTIFVDLYNDETSAASPRTDSAHFYNCHCQDFGTSYYVRSSGTSDNRIPPYGLFIENCSTTINYSKFIGSVFIHTISWEFSKNIRIENTEIYNRNTEEDSFLFLNKTSEGNYFFYSGQYSGLKLHNVNFKNNIIRSISTPTQCFYLENEYATLKNAPTNFINNWYGKVINNGKNYDISINVKLDYQKAYTSQTVSRDVSTGVTTTTYTFTDIPAINIEIPNGIYYSKSPIGDTSEIISHQIVGIFEEHSNTFSSYSETYGTGYKSAQPLYSCALLINKNNAIIAIPSPQNNEQLTFNVSINGTLPRDTDDTSDTILV